VEKRKYETPTGFLADTMVTFEGVVTVREAMKFPRA
jgi:hypothetical protein